MERKLLALTDAAIKFSGSKAGTFEGYASVFGGVDSYGDTIVRGAFKKAIDSGQRPKMFFNHRSWDIPVGKWTHVEEDSKGLLVAGEFTPGLANADAVKAAMQHGTIDGLSIGFRMGPDDYDQTDKGRLIKNVSELVEVSVVSFPADSAARVDLGSVKSALDAIGSLAELEDFLREAGGFSKGLATAVASKARTLSRGDHGKQEVKPSIPAIDLREAFRLRV